MITLQGYSKDPSIQPDGICVTWGKDLIQEKGGLFSFLRYFERIMKDEETLWLQKCKNKPQHDIIYVYIIVANRVYYRLNYIDWQKGQTQITNGSGDGSWCSSSVINWPRLVLAGPVVKAPIKIKLSGFQGFRYCTKLF